MLKKLFSCLGDSVNQEQQTDLSRANKGAQDTAKPILHPESNIQGQAINFETDDFQSTNLLQMHFIQKQSPSRQQKYYYEQEDGEVESKITTASPSKTQYYQQPPSLSPIPITNEDNNSNNEAGDNLYFKANYQQNPLIPDFSPNGEKLAKDDFSQTSAQTSQLAEKKLNNYLNQAKFLMSAQQNTTPFSPSQTISPVKGQQLSTTNIKKNVQKTKGKPFSQDLGAQQRNATEVIHMSHMQSFLPTHMQNIYSLDSCPSSKMLFGSNQDTFEPYVSNDQIALKGSFNSTAKRNSNVKKPVDNSRKSYSDKKSQIISMHKSRHSEGLKEAGVSNFYSHRNSEFSRSSTQGNPVRPHGSTLSKRPQQIVEQLNTVIVEDVQDEVMELQVLDYFDDNSGHQIDLGHIKAVNKRQTSKTEVFSPLGHKKQGSYAPYSSKQPLLQQQVSSKANLTRISGVTPLLPQHKKTVSITQSSATRNNDLRSKHMTTTTSPVMDRKALDKAQARARLGSYKKPSGTNIRGGQISTQPSPVKKGRPTLDDNEGQKRLETQQQPPHFQLLHREIDIINSSITPSSSSNFQFQPKFFKPKFSTNQSNVGGYSQSMESSDAQALQSLVFNMEQLQQSDDN